MRVPHSLVLFALLVRLGSANVHGVLQGNTVHPERHIRVDVIARGGRLAASVPVRTDGSFSIVGPDDGVYVLSVIGSVSWAYAPMHLHVSKGGETIAVEPRADPLILPASWLHRTAANISHPLLLRPHGRATHVALPKQWTIAELLRNRFLMFQIVAVAFIVLFPRYLNTLDSETLAELTGEVQTEQLDPNVALKALIALEDNIVDDVAPVISNSSL